MPHKGQGNSANCSENETKMYFCQNYVFTHAAQASRDEIYPESINVESEM